VLTITSDDGREFADHKQVASAVNGDFYFAHPYSSWERGTNLNRVLRALITMKLKQLC